MIFLHQSVHMILTVMFTDEIIYVQGHPLVAQNVVESVVILSDQLRKKDILFLCCENLSIMTVIPAFLKPETLHTGTSRCTLWGLALTQFLNGRHMDDSKCFLLSQFTP